MIRINKELVEYVTRLHQSNGSGVIHELVLKPGEIVIEQRKRIFATYIMKSGIAKCYMTEDTGVDFIQEFFGEGALFGEVEMFNDELTFCTIQAISEIVVYKIPGSDFHQLLGEDKKFNRSILNAMANKIRYSAKRHAYNQSHTIESNLSRLQKAIPNLLDVISKKDIANYLGITERSLNRTLSAIR